MTAVLQRVKSAKVYADGDFSGECGEGLFILLGVAVGDTAEDARLLAEKISKLRIFSDENGKMNLSVKDIGGSALVVSNFTLNANYAHGNRPDFLASAPPEEANDLYEKFKLFLAEKTGRVESGKFGADMRIESVCDGPVTIIMDSKLLGGKKRDT